MTLRAPCRRWLLVGFIALFAACGVNSLQSQWDRIGATVREAQRNGAQRCAPVELAMAESHHDFAAQDISEGNYHRAREELTVAKRNAKLAVEKSPPGKCTGTEAPKPAPKPSDLDGDGILDKDDQCPRDPEDFDDFQDEDGCPDDDNDEDGIVDRDDKCPTTPEDKDGFEDEDGCPEDDNDKDGLADKIDKCPDEPEDADGFEDDDGCPDCDNDGDGVPECPQAIDKCPDKPAKTADGCPAFKRIVVTKTKIELKQTIYFETAKAIIRSRSYPLLNEVAQALKDRKAITVRIEGHTDSRGKDDYNLQLSKDRARAVKDYLVGQGVESARMVSEGYGETKPIADNRTRRGRGENRRVEFVITSQ